MKKKIVMLALVCAICITGCGKSKPAKAVDELILGLGDITIESEESIVAAEEYYETLTETQKNEVENYKSLVDARKQLDMLIQEELEKEREKQEKEEVEQFVAQLNNIKNEKVKKQADIEEITKKYDELTDVQKGYITDASLFDDAISLTDYEKAAISAVDQLRNTLKNKDSLKLMSVAVRTGGKKTTAAYYVLVKYSATNGFGAAIDDTTCIDVTKDFSSSFWTMTRLMGSLGAAANVSKQDLTIYNLYLNESTNEMEVDCDRIMNNIN